MLHQIFKFLVAFLAVNFEINFKNESDQQMILMSFFGSLPKNTKKKGFFTPPFLLFYQRSLWTSLTKDIDQVGQRTTTINNRSRVAASTEDNIHHHHAQQHHQQGKTKKGIFNWYLYRLVQVFMSGRDLEKENFFQT